MMFSGNRLFVIVLVLLLGGGVALAAPTEPPKEDKQGDTSTTKEKAKPEPKKAKPRKMPGVTELEELIVIGRIQKPEVLLILGRGEFRYKGLDLKRSFVDEIIKSVRTNPF